MAKHNEIVDGWRQMATMYRLKTVGRDRVLNELIRRGKVSEQEIRELRKKHVREAAKEEKFDLDAAENRFMKKK